MESKKLKWIIVSVIPAILAGCAAPPKLSADLQSELAAPLHCDGEAECATMWERATYFVNANAGFKLQVHNDSIIETYTPYGGATELAFSISKEPLGKGKYRIWTKVYCANNYGCHPNEVETLAKAKRYMRTGIK